MKLDQLVVDQDGIPTSVEVGRHSDLRLRREVGQVLKYAANAARSSGGSLSTRGFREDLRKARKGGDSSRWHVGWLYGTKLGRIRILKKCMKGGGSCCVGVHAGEGFLFSDRG
jgi:hypothetical protein